MISMGGIREIEGVHVFRMGRPFGSDVLYPVYCFLVGNTLIDTGSNTGKNFFKQVILKYPVKQVLITHSHEDHIGNAALVHSQLNIPIYAHPHAVEVMTNPHQMKLLIYQQFFWGYPLPSPAQSIPTEVESDGFHFEVIPTPGHADDHLCFFEPSHGWIFTGDLFLGDHISYLRPHENYTQTLASLKLLLQRQPRILFCGFKGVVSNATERIAKKIQYMESLRDQTLQLAADGWSIPQITHHLLGKEDFISWATEYDYCKRHVIEKIITEHQPRIASTPIA